MATDPLADLAALPGVEAALAAARDRVDAVLWDRAVRARAAEVAAGSRLRGAWASAALDGAEVRPDALVSGDALDGSPIGRVVAASLALQAEVPSQADLLGRAPLQVLSHLHAVVSAGFVPDAERGRPRGGSDVDDPLRLGPAPSPAEASARMTALGRLLAAPTSAPAMVLAAVVHAEVAVVRPFAWGSGLVARSLSRLVLAARGVDPDGLTVPEAGLFAAGRPAYTSALTAYAGGDPEGLARWLVLHADCVRVGAEESYRILRDLPA
ncbi:MAG: oxidoreductase [Frankiales bacterium]|nr:oxidoreductase [Frankiales bacterium]